MSQFYVVIDRLLHEVAVLLPICLWDDVPYQLLDAGVDVFLGIARHGRILTAAAERGREGPLNGLAGLVGILGVGRMSCLGGGAADSATKVG